MSKKTLPTDGIMNELEGASLFFSPKKLDPPQPTNSPQYVPQDNQEIDPLPATHISNLSGKLVDPLPSSEPEIVSDQINPPLKPVTKIHEKKKEPTNERTNDQTFGRTHERFIKRAKIRHTFDIFADQLMSLREISIEQEKFTGERVLLGDLAQQAFDMFISKQRNK